MTSPVIVIALNNQKYSLTIHLPVVIPIHNVLHGARTGCLQYLSLAGSTEQRVEQSHAIHRGFEALSVALSVI